MKKTVRKMFFAWNGDKEKEFLEEMALKGYRLVKVKLGKYIFEEEQPKKLIFQFDFRSFDKMSEAEYLQIYEDAGWSFVARIAGWYYFSREWNQEEIDLSLFNNNRSRSAMYKRLLFFLLLTGFPLYYQVLLFFPAMTEAKIELPRFYSLFRIIVLILTGLHLVAAVRIFYLYRNINRDVSE